MQRRFQGPGSGVTVWREGPLQVVNRLIHRHFLVMLISAYVLSAVYPQFGLILRNIQFGHVTWPDGSHTKLSLALLMLSFLLFNAGIAIKFEELIALRRRPAVPLAGFAANALLPIALIVSLLGVMHLWHDQDEIQNLLVGLALIVSMPIAGSSTAWTQNADGNISLSLGLVFLSTVLSPITVPIVMYIFSYFTKNDYSEDLQKLASQGTSGFLILTIVLPSLAGILMHFACGEAVVRPIRVALKLANYVILLLLNYSNASTALPQALGKPDVDYLIFIGGITFALCVAAYGSGWLLSRWLRTDRSDQISLMFGLGMHNTGTALVFATSELPAHPGVLLPLIFCTLMQQVIAAVIDHTLFSNNSPDGHASLAL